MTYSRLSPEPEMAQRPRRAPSGDPRVEPKLRAVPSNANDLVPVAPAVRDVAGFDGGAEQPPYDDLRLAEDEPRRRRKQRQRRGRGVFRFMLALGLFAFLAGAGVLAATFVGIMQTAPLPDTAATATVTPDPLDTPLDVTPATDTATLTPEAAPTDTTPSGWATPDQRPTNAELYGTQPDGSGQSLDNNQAFAPADTQAAPASSDNSLNDPRFGSDTAAGPAMEGNTDADLLMARGQADLGPDIQPLQDFGTQSSGTATVSQGAPRVPSVDDPGPVTSSLRDTRPFPDGTGATGANAPAPAALLPPEAGGTDDPALLMPADGEALPVPPADIPNVRKPTLGERLRAIFDRPRG